ncbi:hypothetical protein ABB28_15775 [Stenotrophomonas chelatiphaga]|jgi:hypothetical protein|uniref:Uncharacterized protein n=2 Tax=Stenotrophomonas TaxID=40323 RepID=A0A0R0CWV1_9GAMM|nr:MULTISPECIES: hypothetical protein [Stenotrophomonas]ROQ43910.1 hypothetical protein EDF77_1674 [Stenotrophomonas maltophilia]KRG69528.1 hypothetical protein ABB28_15775 [Stenotrophomonas chelatiphaga]MBD7955783.1 hypothetical protein [Stenotrophomonas pennii]MBJ7517463.1 hypothetical protein [Stenotrophomonas sp.]MCS4232743.1 hypothetical protein [Stenotrophomonas chelatiphaga]
MAKYERQDNSETRWLSFRLRNGQSIAPAKLRAGWAAAAAVPGISVRREDIESGTVVYALYGPSSLGAPQVAEMRMRQFLMDEGYTFTMGTLGARPGIRL